MLKGFFDFLWDSRGGIAILLLTIFSIGIIVQWMAWIFRCGRFTQSRGSGIAAEGERDLGYVVVQFFVKLIDDFRHFLALVLVLIFAGVLAAAVSKAGNQADDLAKAVQGVVATLGGLIGSIVGYYFGESAARNARRTTTIVNEVPQQGGDVRGNLPGGQAVPPPTPAGQPPPPPPNVP